MGKEFNNKKGGHKPNFSSHAQRGTHGPNKYQKRGGVGAKGKQKTIIEPHKFPGIFIAKTPKEDLLVTLNFAPGQIVYGEKHIQIESKPTSNTSSTTNNNNNSILPSPKIEYRVWNAFRSKLAACIINGVKHIYMGPGSKVLYIGASSGTTISHVSDIVGETGAVYGIEISKRSGRDFTNMSKLRPNLIPIIEDARKPWRYRMMVSMVDCIFADVATPDQARIIELNAFYFLKNNGGFVFSIKASCIDSTAEPEAVFASQIQELRKNGFKVKEQVTLQPFEKDHCVVTGIYRAKKKEE